MLDDCSERWLSCAFAQMLSLRACCWQADAAETKGDVKAPPADIRRYLKATGLIELRYIRKLSSLCAQTYYIRKLTVRHT